MLYERTFAVSVFVARGRGRRGGGEGRKEGGNTISAWKLELVRSFRRVILLLYEYSQDVKTKPETHTALYDISGPHDEHQPTLPLLPVAYE